MDAVYHENQHSIEAVYDQIPSDFVLDFNPMLEVLLIHSESVALGRIGDVEKISNESQVQRNAGDFSVAESTVFDVLQK